MANSFAEFTEESNAIDYLEKTVVFIKAAKDNPQEWKWVSIAIHGALYGFMICTLKGTNPDNVCITTKVGDKKLINFREALKRCQRTDCMALGGFTALLSLGDNEKIALNVIHDEFRNQFLHYRPTSWVIEVTGMPDIILRGLDVIHHITQDMGSYFVHYDRTKVANLVAAGRQALK